MGDNYLLDNLPYEDTFAMLQHLFDTNIAGVIVQKKGKLIAKKTLKVREQDKDILLALLRDTKSSKFLSVHDIKQYAQYNKLATSQKSRIISFHGVLIEDENSDHSMILFIGSNKAFKLEAKNTDLFQIQSRQLAYQIFSALNYDKTRKNLKSSKKIIKHHEQNYQAVLDSAGDMLFELDINGHFLSVNNKLREALGYDDNEFSQMHYTDLVPKYKQRKLTEFLENIQRKNTNDSYEEFPLITKNGLNKWVGLKLAVVYPEDSEKKLIVVARDITKQKEAINKLARYRNGLKLINEIASNANFTLKEQIYLALEVGSSYLGLEVADIGQVIGDSYHVKFSQLAHPDYNIKLREKYKLNEVFSDVTFHQDEVVAISHIKESEFKNHPCYLEIGLESYIGTPYYIKGKKEGTLSFFSLTPRHQPFDENEIDFIKIFARWIGFILERERNQNSLLSEQGMLRAFASFSPAAIAMFDKEMEYLAATERWVEENGMTSSKILGKKFYDEFPNYKKEWIDYHKRVLKGEVISVEEDWYLTKEGQKMWVTWAARPWYNDAHEIGGVIVFMQNITLQKKQAEELMRAKEAAEKASQAKDQFLSTMSHEIRTPLNAVIGAGHLLLQEDPRPDQVQNLSLLKNSGEHLLSLVNDVLDFNKIEEGQLKLEEISFDFQKLISSIQFTMEQSAKEKNIDFKLDLDSSIPNILKGDPTRISQILINLLNNAIKFTDKGYVSIKTSLMESYDNSVKLHFEVLDSGIGITDAQLKSIFERFTQADKDTTRKYGGSGLGLTITRRLLEIMESKIQVSSELGKGSKFFFDLTLKLGDSSKVVNDNITTTNGSKTSGIKKVLLVDDHEVNRIMASKFLTKWGLVVDLACNGKDCLDMIEDQSYDLVLMDLQMPEMDGFEATNQIRSREETYFQDIPIIALTASALVETREQVMKVGMNDYVTKPFNPKVFRNKLARHLKDPSLAE